MFKVLVLICAASVPRSECQIWSALNVYEGPETRNEVACGFQTQAFLAQASFERPVREDEYVKIMCRRTVIGQGNVG